jgi:hypothetical protein
MYTRITFVRMKPSSKRHSRPNFPLEVPDSMTRTSGMTEYYVRFKKYTNVFQGEAFLFGCFD